MGKLRSSIQLLKYADTVTTFHAGDVIFQQGDRGKEMFVVKAGRVDLELNGRVIETLDAGDILGEMALVDHDPRSATARAKTDCQLVSIDEEKFVYLVRQTPYFAVEVMQIMAKRLRHMNAEGRK